MTQLQEHVSVTETNEGMAILDERSGDYFVVNGLGAHVVRQLLGGVEVAGIIAQVKLEHPDAADQVEHDIRAFVTALDEAGVTR